MTGPALRRSDGGPLVAALAAIAAAGALVCYLLPFLYVVLPLLVVVAAAGRRELRIRRRLRGIEVDSPGQSLPASRVALPAAPLQIEGGASL